MSDLSATLHPPKSQPQPASTSVSNTGNVASSQISTANQPARRQNGGPHQTATVSAGPATSEAPPTTAPEGEERGQTSGSGDDDKSESVPERQITEDGALKEEIKGMEEEEPERSCNRNQLALRGPSKVAVDTPEQPPEESSEYVEQPERMSSPKSRLQSFSGLRDEERGTRITKLAEAGFYYNGTVMCFSCGGTLSKWSSGDNPWIEHGRLYPQCKFLIQKKGQTFVDAVQNICKPFPGPKTARRNQRAIGQTRTRETAVQEGGLPTNTDRRTEPNTQPQKKDHNVSGSDGLYATAKGSASNLSHPGGPIQETHAAEAAFSSGAEISVSPASQVQATYSWSEGQEIAQETEGHAGSSSTARPAYSVSTEEPARDRSPANYVNGEGTPWMFTFSQPVEEQHDDQQPGEEELGDDDSQGDQAEDDGGIAIDEGDLRDADISLIEGQLQLCLHCEKWEREVWLPCGHWFVCGSCFFCSKFWHWHVDNHDIPICLVCQEPFEYAEIPRHIVIFARNRRRTGRCACYQRKG